MDDNAFILTLMLIFVPFIIVMLIAFFSTQPKRPHISEAQRLFTQRTNAFKLREKEIPLQPKSETGVTLGITIDNHHLSWCQHDQETNKYETYIALPPWALEKHGVLIGASGSGKTVTLLRIAYIAAKYGYRVFYLDGKGDQQNAARFLHLMRHTYSWLLPPDNNPYNISTQQVTRYINKTRIHLFPQESYNGWQGNATAILNRLMAIVDYTEPYYKAVAKKVLTTICNDQAGPPHSSSELIQRLENLKIADLRLQDVEGVKLRYTTFFDALGRQLDGTWSFEEAVSGYLLLDSLALKDETASLGRFFLEDFAHYATTRKQRRSDNCTKDLLIVDEFSAFSTSGADMANLVERLRSYGCAIILSSQSYAGLGPDAERILNAVNWYILHQCSDPEQLTRRAGTEQRVEQSYTEGIQSASTSYHTVERPRLNANIVRQLIPGEAVAISQGNYAHFFVAPPPENEDDETEEDRETEEEEKNTYLIERLRKAIAEQPPEEQQASLAVIERLNEAIKQATEALRTKAAELQCDEDDGPELRQWEDAERI